MATHRVYLVRHARAEGTAPTDEARRLTAEGRARFERLAHALGPRLAVARIVTSPFARTVQTAEILAGVLGEIGGRGGAAVAPAVEEDDRLASGASGGRRILELAERAGAGAALVGHNPEMAEAIGLAAGSEIEVRPGTVAAVDLEDGVPRLAWLEAP